MLPNAKQRLLKIVVEDVLQSRRIDQPVAPVYNRMHADYNAITNLDGELRDMGSGRGCRPQYLPREAGTEASTREPDPTGP